MQKRSKVKNSYLRFEVIKPAENSLHSFEGGLEKLHKKNVRACFGFLKKYINGLQARI
jgi:hypothetical protein